MKSPDRKNRSAKTRGRTAALAEPPSADASGSGAEKRPSTLPPPYPRRASRGSSTAIDASSEESFSPRPAERQIDESLLSNFTHQIINPLNGVLGTLDNIIDGTVSEHRRIQRLKAARGQLVGTVELVRNLAYLSQLSTEKGREGLRKVSVDVVVPEVIIQAAQFFQESAEQRGIEIHLANRETQYVVKAHRDLLRQVFMNIIENGVKYGDASSTITITARPQRSTDKLFVEVEGTGPGFDTSEREAIFELGFRGNEAQRVRASGSGIGLFVCRQILGLYGAEIEAEYSAAGRRTLFRARFGRFTLNEPRRRRHDGKG